MKKNINVFLNAMSIIFTAFLPLPSAMADWNGGHAIRVEDATDDKTFIIIGGILFVVIISSLVILIKLRKKNAE
jgi:hypothetical protein